jgi:penicillin-insensitive murein endopeptidase
VRPWWGHHYHFHVRLACPDDSPGCVDQPPPPGGDGCDATLDWWFTDEPWQPSDTEPKPLLRLGDLPAACRTLATLP